jgi:hypothetical protein
LSESTRHNQQMEGVAWSNAASQSRQASVAEKNAATNLTDTLSRVRVNQAQIDLYNSNAYESLQRAKTQDSQRWLNETSAFHHITSAITDFLPMKDLARGGF